MEEKITLDRDSFKSLASETRISIIKSLDRRRKTLTELSKELKMSPSSVKEHMDNLCAASLSVQVDDGHKWKYYELTRKGKNILHPDETRIWVLLSVSILAMSGIFYDLLQRGAGGLGNTLNAAESLVSPTGSPAKAMAPALDSCQAAAQPLPYLHIIGLVLFAVLLGSCIAYLAISRKRLMARI